MGKERTLAMLDDFFFRALLAGLGLAAIAGPMGCFIVWKRMAYFGDTLAHSALLGAAFGLLLQANITLAVFATGAVISLILLSLQKNRTLPSDALLGILSHGSLALSLVTLSLMAWVRFDLQALLFGDILSVSRMDLAIIFSVAVVSLGILLWFWQTLFAATVSYDLAEAEAMRPATANLVFMLLLAAVIAVAMKIVGVLLITALLIIPAVCARAISSTPERMAVISAIVGMASVVLGMGASMQFDTPSGPTIIIAALALFVLSLSPFVRAIRGGAHGS